jgi:uncharacterized membrane protein HdeD (DUF308 family)
MNLVYRRVVLVFGLVAIALGFAILVRTAWSGGGIGYVFGCLFVAVGAGRLYLLRRR